MPERWCAGGVAPNLTHVWISHDPQQGSALPACAARQLPHLIAHWPGGMEFAGRTRLKSGVPPPPRPAPSRSSGAGGLEALLVVAAVAACMAASRVLWVRRRAAQRPGPSGRRARPLEQPLSSVGVQSEAGVTNGAGPAQQLHRRRRRRQFEMMLQSEPSRLSVLPLEQLPHALMAHRLRSARPAPASSRGSQPADDDGTERSSLLPQPADSAAATGGGGCAWALETDSLRLQPEALEVRVGGSQGCRRGAASPGRFIQCWPCSRIALLAPPCAPCVLQLVLDQQGGLVELGAGAYAEVFLGRVQGREVAVKVRRSILDGSGVRRATAAGVCSWGYGCPGCAMAVPARPPPPLPQVFQLPPGDACAAAWNEVALLRRCAHERICAILGVCLLVGCGLSALPQVHAARPPAGAFVMRRSPWASDLQAAALCATSVRTSSVLHYLVCRTMC